MRVGEKGRLTQPETLALWQQYKASGDARLRDRLVLTLAPLVRYIVYRKIREVPAHLDVDDFVSVGLEALLRSIDRFDPDKGATLEQFAWTRVHGAVIDELRRGDWAPRSVRRWERDVSKARDRLQAEHGRQPTRAELGERLGVSVDDLSSGERDVAQAELGSLNALVLAEDDTSIERVDALPSADLDADPEAATTRSAAVELLRQALSELPERERNIATLLYADGRTLREIGTMIGVT
jgi:RNA polymerase sigma factor for flagellar operon FliA